MRPKALRSTEHTKLIRNVWWTASRHRHFSKGPQSSGNILPHHHARPRSSLASYAPVQHPSRSFRAVPTIMRLRPPVKSLSASGQGFPVHRNSELQNMATKPQSARQSSSALRNQAMPRSARLQLSEPRARIAAPASRNSSRRDDSRALRSTLDRPISVDHIFAGGFVHGIRT